MKEVPDEKFNETISKGALKLTSAQINTVSFVFWLCYMAEIDLESVLTNAWQIASAPFSQEERTLAKSMLKNMAFGTRDLKLDDALTVFPPETINKIQATVDQNYITRRDVDVEGLEYFSDKIKIYEAFYDKNERTKLLWKINQIRNDVSHNRIDQLTYNNESLELRETKEKLLIEYLRTSFTSKFEDTNFYKRLTPDQKPS